MNVLKEKLKNIFFFETNFGIVELKEVEMLFNKSNFIESEQQPNDSEVI